MHTPLSPAVPSTSSNHCVSAPSVTSQPKHRMPRVRRVDPGLDAAVDLGCASKSQREELLSVLRSRSVESPSGCRLWAGAVASGKKGLVYGSLQVARRQRLAHRVAFALEVGPIPEGMIVCHKCDVRLCINVDHLFLGTHADNARDKIAKGRANMPSGPEHFLFKVSDEMVRAISVEPGSKSRVAQKFGVSATTVANIRHRRFRFGTILREGATQNG